MRSFLKLFAPRLALATSALLATLAPLAAQNPVPMVTYENTQYRFTASLPAGCRQDEGPGTIDAVCSAELDAERSASAPVEASLVLEVTAERIGQDATPQPAAATPPFTAADFRDELPDAICGLADKARVKIEDVQEAAEPAGGSFTATVGCPEMKFVALPERKARVRFVITPSMRYRLFARAPVERFEQSKDIIDKFLASFRVLPQSN